MWNEAKFTYELKRTVKWAMNGENMSRKCGVYESVMNLANRNELFHEIRL